VKEIERYGVVSSKVAKQMAVGVRKAFGTTFGLSTTGVAGPTGGTRKTPVGTVFIAFTDGKRTSVKRLQLKGTRREIKEAAAGESLQFLLEQIKQSIPLHPPFAKGGKGGFPRGADDGPSMRIYIERLRRSDASEIVLVRRAPQGISGRKGRLGIFPASFNPPTLAHVALIREAIRKERLAEVLVLLDLQAMDKEQIEATFEDRLAMLKKVFGKDPKISIGISNQGLFLEKLKPLQSLYPGRDEVVFIVGFDTILRVLDKKYYENRGKSLDGLFRQCRFLVANRDFHEETAFEDLFRKRENRKYAERVGFITLSKNFSTFSSSLVRQRLAQGRPVDRWVPAILLPFLQEKGLYRAITQNR
jgi:nicotinate (nicotinamide) nucleotide adenylyltransferase